MSATRTKYGLMLPIRRPQSLIVISTFCILLAVIAGLWTTPSLLPDVASQFAGSHLAESRSADPLSVVPHEYQVKTQTLAQQYMTALLRHQYSIIWSLLHPQVQAMWPSEAAFTTFWQTRFQDYILQSFTLGKVSWLRYWVNPETMVKYNQVLQVPVSLRLQPDLMLQQQPSAPPEDLHPEQVLKNIPFIVQRIASSKGHGVHWLVLDGGPADLEAPILPPVQPVSKTVQVPILMYHHISDATPKNLLERSLTVTTTAFKRQLDYLQEQGYHTITFNQLFDALYYNGPLPQHPIILTFDDGYKDAYRFAFPILQAHGFSGMFYIITGKVGWNGYMNWEQIRSMLAAGMQIGSHTIHHVDMGQLLRLSPNLAQQELQESQAELQKRLGIVIQQFCYPSGEPFRHGSLAIRQEIVALLAADGYVGATTDPGMTGTFQDSQAPFVLLRIRVDGRETFPEFVGSLPW